MKQAFESRLNILLSELLNQIGVISHSEYLGIGRKDIIIYHQGLAIVLEGSYDRKDAENDAKKRIEQLTADVAIAIHYHDSFPQDMTESEIKVALKKCRFYVRVIVPEDVSETLYKILYEKDIIAKSLEDWYELDINYLATLIKSIAEIIISEDVVKSTEEEVNDLVEQFVNNLVFHKESATIANNLYNALYKLYGFSIGNPSEIKEAIFAQATLALLLGAVYYESIRYAHNLDSVMSMSTSIGAEQALEKATRNILEINYEPIFELVSDLIKSLPQMKQPFNKLVNLSIKIASQKALLRRDLAGKIYHRVVGDWALKKGLATFFTQVPAAYFLLYLAKPDLTRIADFACGSGTLLVAAYSAASTQYRYSLLRSGVDKNPADIDREFHTNFLNLCHAFDVLGYASQITALNLALHSPETPITKSSHIYTLPLGYREKDTSVSLGSLELARTTSKLDQVFSQAVRRGLVKKETQSVIDLLKLKPVNFIAMNPPFSRTTGRGGKSGGGLFGFMGDEAARKHVLKNYAELRNDIHANMEEVAIKLLRDTYLERLLTDKELRSYKNIWQAGEGLLFLYLADIQLKSNGKICFVLPKGLLSGVSWFLARTFLASKYHIESIIVSYENDNYNFSESTSLSECMFVARKKTEHDENDKTNFIILLKKPRTSIEAISLSNAIDALEGARDEYVQSGKAKAFIVRIIRNKLLNNLDNWGRFAYLPNLTLIEEIEDILEGVLNVGNHRLKLPMVRLDQIISSIGVDRHRFTDTFKPIDEDIPGTIRMLKGGGEEQRQRIMITPNAYALPIIDRGKVLFEDKGGTLLVPDRIRFNTAHVTAMLSDKKLLSNIFYIVRLKNETEERLKALCLWFNTTWGILTILASREETHGAFITLKMSHWKLLPVLDVNSLHDEKIRELAILFDKFKTKKLMRIPMQYGTNGRVEPSRLDLDLSFLKIMGCEVEENQLLQLYSEIRQSLKQWIGL